MKTATFLNMIISNEDEAREKLLESIIKVSVLQDPDVDDSYQIIIRKSCGDSGKYLGEMMNDDLISRNDIAAMYKALGEIIEEIDSRAES